MTTATEISWRLEITGECPGPDFWSRFELPVFDVGEQRADHDVAPATSEPALERPEPSKLASLGIVCETTPQGGEAWTFRRAQHKSVATIMTTFAVVVDRNLGIPLDRPTCRCCFP